MKQQTAKIVALRKENKIPVGGFREHSEALGWYRLYFKSVKKLSFKGSLGFKYDLLRDQLSYDYRLEPDGIFISTPYPLDMELPFDVEVAQLTDELELERCFGPALRLYVLMGRLPEDDKLPLIPQWLIAPLGDFRLLLHPTNYTSLRQWRKLGKQMGVIAADNETWTTPGVTQDYGYEKWGKKQKLYWETLMAYCDVVAERRAQKRQRERGILKETGQMLVKEYGWNQWDVDSYVVHRYLKRAKARWPIDGLPPTNEA